MVDKRCHINAFIYFHTLFILNINIYTYIEKRNIRTNSEKKCMFVWFWCKTLGRVRFNHHTENIQNIQNIQIIEGD